MPDPCVTWTDESETEVSPNPRFEVHQFQQKVLTVWGSARCQDTDYFDAHSSTSVVGKVLLWIGDSSVPHAAPWGEDGHVNTTGHSVEGGDFLWETNFAVSVNLQNFEEGKKVKCEVVFTGSHLGDPEEVKVSKEWSPLDQEQSDG